MKSQSLRKISLVTALLLATCLAFSQTSDQQQAQFQRTFSLNPGGTLLIENYKGLIRISGTDAKQVTVSVDRKFEGSDKDRAWWMARNHVNFSSDPARLSVHVEYPNTNCNFLSDCENDHDDYTAWVELTIQVPRQVSLEINGYKPEMNITNIQGDIRIKSYKSPIDISPSATRRSRCEARSTMAAPTSACGRSRVPYRSRRDFRFRTGATARDSGSRRSPCRWDS